MKYCILLLLLAQPLFCQTLNPNQPLDILHHKADLALSLCENTSKYWLGNSGTTSYNDYALYVPKDNQDVIYINLNFVIIQYAKHDPRNFDKNNAQHMQYLNDMVNEMNYRISHFNQYNSNAKCKPIDIFDSKIQFIPQFYFVENEHLWDYTHYNYTKIIDSDEIDALDKVISQKPNYRPGINIYLSNNANAYRDLIQNYTAESYGAYNEKFSNYVLYGNHWARTPSNNNLDKQPRVIWANAFIKYNTLLWYFSDHLGKDRKKVYSWLIEPSSSIIHEIGHNLGLSHASEQDKTAYQNASQKCYENFMSQKYGHQKQLFDRVQLGKIYRNLSNSSARNAVSTYSFDGTTRAITSHEVWDIDTRIYSNIVIENGAELKITCKVTMPPQAFIMVKKGGSLILDGGEILSADNTPWEGILVHKRGKFKILSPIDSQETKNINTFKAIDKKLEKIILQRPNKHLVKSITPNPFSKSLTITFKEKLHASIVIYDINGKVAYREKYDGQQKEINLSVLTAGIYFIAINTHETSNVFKIVKL